MEVQLCGGQRELERDPTSHGSDVRVDIYPRTAEYDCFGPADGDNSAVPDREDDYAVALVSGDGLSSEEEVDPVSGRVLA